MSRVNNSRNRRHFEWKHLIFASGRPGEVNQVILLTEKYFFSMIAVLFYFSIMVSSFRKLNID